MRKVVPRFFRLTIARKLLLGFVSYGILTILIALIALSSLQRLNEINHRIINRDIPLAEIGDKMIETLLAQELYGRRSVILKSSEMEALFWSPPPSALASSPVSWISSPFWARSWERCRQF